MKWWLELGALRGPEVCPGPASLSDWECVQKSGGYGSNFLLRDLRFGAEPVFQLVTVLPAACLVEFLRAEAL